MSAPTDLLASLDPDQHRAVTAPPTPLMVVAGAGSGKTKMLTHRVARMIEESIVTPDQMFVSAFTKAAADEMQERVLVLLSEQHAGGLTVATFHSLMFRMLQADRVSKGLARLEVCKDSERTRILRDLLDHPSRDFPQALNIEVDIAQVGAWISTWKNGLLHFDDEEIIATADENPRDHPMGAAALVYPLYEQHLASVGKIDFDDMLIDAYDLLATDGGALAAARARWSAFLIDECQDTNVAQWQIIELIAPPENHPNITIVGDTRQALFRFRGAVPELMEGFAKRYPGATRIDLTMNYRSTPQIIDHANRLVANFNLPDQKHSRPDGLEATIGFFHDEVEQGVEIANLVTEARGQGHKGGDVAVLIRTNAQSARIESAFVAAKLPYWCRNGGFYDRMEIGDIIAYLRLAHDRTDQVSLRRIINRPTRYLGAAFCDAVASTAERAEGDIVTSLRRVFKTRGRNLSTRQLSAANDLADLLDGLGATSDAEISPAIAISRVLENTQYLDWLKRTSGGEVSADESRAENLESLRAVATGFSTLKEFIDFINETSRLQVQNKDATEISTVHRAKGREWPIVVVSSFYEGSFPHKKAMMEGNVEDERRTAYVSLTRARDALYITVPGMNDKLDPVFPSPFLGDAGFDLQDKTDPEMTWWGTLPVPTN